MSETLIAAWIGVAGTVIAGLGGAWLGAKIARDTGRNLLIQQARAEFANAFGSTLVKLSGPAEEDRMGRAMHILKEDYLQHLLAYIRLRSILPKQKQEAVDKAWSQYTNDEKYSLPQEREFYRFSHVLSPESDEHQFMLAAKHINILLSSTAA